MIFDFLSEKIGQDCSFTVLSFLEYNDKAIRECNNRILWKYMVIRDFDRNKFFWTNGMVKQLGWKELYLLLRSYNNDAWFVFVSTMCLC